MEKSFLYRTIHNVCNEKNKLEAHVMNNYCKQNQVIEKLKRILRLSIFCNPNNLNLINIP